MKTRQLVIACSFSSLSFLLTVLIFTYTELYLLLQLYILFRPFTSGCFFRAGFEVDAGGEASCAQMPRRRGYKGTLSHRWADGTHLLPHHLFTAAGGWCDNHCSPAARGPGPQKPQAGNECHTIVTTCTFMERGGRTSLAQMLAVCEETSSMNQTIKERAGKHLWNLWWELADLWPLLKKGCFQVNVSEVESSRTIVNYHFPNVTKTSVNYALQLVFSMIFHTSLIWICHMLSMNSSRPNIRFSN